VRVGAERSVVPVAADLEVLGAAGVLVAFSVAEERFSVRLVFVFDVRGLGAIARPLDSKIFGCDLVGHHWEYRTSNALLL